jgi:glucose dehydrogenase
VWSNQRTEGDLWNLRFPFSSENPDFDFGDSAQVYTLSNGRKVVGAGQKSGFYHVLDAATGDEVLAPSSTCPAASSGVSSRTPPWPTMLARSVVVLLPPSRLSRVSSV